MQQISLYYKDGSSDKVYHAQIEPEGSGFVVNFQYGRRGSALTPGAKTKAAVTKDEAEKIFNKLVQEKTSKGYTEGENGAVFQSKTYEDRVTGIVPQLLNKITDEVLEKYLKDDNFVMEEKYNGKRIIIKCEKKKITCINKKGLETLIHQSVCDLVLALNRDITLDGELIGEKYYIFDILALDGVDLMSQPYKERYAALVTLKMKQVVPAFFTYKDKKDYFQKVKAAKGEGVVFKHIDAPYVSGRPASGGNQLKYKFYETGTFEVLSHHKSKSSVAVAAYENKNLVTLGSVTIPPNASMPPVGSFVEVRYLYCHVGGALYQSKYLGERDDQDKSDCTLAQIKFKAVDDDEEDE